MARSRNRPSSLFYEGRLLYNRVRPTVRRLTRNAAELKPIVRITLFNTEGRMVSYIGEPMPGDSEKLGEMWHKGIDPRSLNESPAQELFNENKRFSFYTPQGQHPFTGETTPLFQHGQPIFDKRGKHLGFGVLSVFLPKTEGLQQFDVGRQTSLLNTARSHLAELEKIHPYSATHSVLVAAYAKAFVDLIDKLIKNGRAPRGTPKDYKNNNGFTEEEKSEALIAGLLHDVGKKMVADLLDKKGKLTKEEFKRMHDHLKDSIDSSAPLLTTLFARRLLEQHHPYYVPAGEEWAWEGRIAAVADVFHALTSQRSYREGHETDPQKVFATMIEAGKKPNTDHRRLDPYLVRVFGEHFSEINANAMNELDKIISARENELRVEITRHRTARENNDAANVGLLNDRVTRYGQALKALKREQEVRLPWTALKLNPKLN